MAVLVIAEHNNYEPATATLSVVAAAGRLSPDVDVLVAGYQCSRVAEQLAACVGVREVLVADAASCEYQLAEDIAAVVVQVGNDYDGFLAASSTTGKDIMPRVAALLNVAQLSDIIDILDADTFQRPVYAGNIHATVRSKDAKKVITVRASAFEGVAQSGGSAGIRPIVVPESPGLSRFIEDSLTESDRPQLTEADVVIAGGRGLGSRENFAMLERLADRLGAAVGASRAAVDAGYVPNDFQVGQTGKIVAPKLYMAVGISGAIQHLAGIKDSKVIVAINRDADAPIFEVADYGLVADLFQVLPELCDALDN